jgi:hypothetical protein
MFQPVTVDDPNTLSVISSCNGLIHSSNQTSQWEIPERNLSLSLHRHLSRLPEGSGQKLTGGFGFIWEIGCKWWIWQPRLIAGGYIKHGYNCSQRRPPKLKI